MATTDEEVEILTRSVSIPEDEARTRVEERLVSKVKGLFSERRVVRTELRYKPYYEFETKLTKTYFFGDDIVERGAIIVDTLTGITRPILERDIDVSEKRVPADRVIEPEIDVDEARTEANGRRMQIEHREKGDLEMAEEPRLVHKPVWLVEIAAGDVLVVDATDGQIISDVVLG